MELDNINDIISGLSSQDIEKLQSLASSIIGDNMQTPSQTASSPPDKSELEMIMKAKKIMDKMNSTTSKDAGLILALKPYLSEQKRMRADQSIRMLKLFEILPYLKELF